MRLCFVRRPKYWLSLLFSRQANARRSTASTKLNDVSSRSHAILSIILSSEDTTTGKITEGKLSLMFVAALF